MYRVRFDADQEDKAQGQESMPVRLANPYGLQTTIEDSLYDTLVAACLLPDTGARNIDSLLNQQILPVLSQQLQSRMSGQQRTTSLALGWDEEEGITLEFGE